MSAIKTGSLKPGNRVYLALLWVSIALLLFVTMFPFYWVFRTSLTPKVGIFSDPTAFLPPGATWTNYGRVLGLIDSATAISLGGSGQTVNFFQNMANSFIVAIGVTLAQVFCSCMAAYAFARLRFKFRDQLFSLYVATLMIPGIVTMLPNFILVKQLGLLNSHLGIMAPTLLMTPFAVFFLRQFLLGINKELEEAAYLDGAGFFATFTKIILPIAATAITTLAVITFITTWNDYMWPLIVGKKEAVRTLTVALGIFRLQTPQGQPDWGGMMAGTTLAMVPTFALFFVFGKKIVDSIGFSGFR
ncbi:MAG: sugar ABC transporter permease [Treponema sp. GWB1_62_6]|nr:MAG: sugar ABC transporter permease [Treponema sp. GWB1_62_6]OHE62875.1 MAG: sugar ABC transporter permease [Treponema sp. GWC1_61_84]HCM26434.1 sugar ABC transporter permease [Treponema sp.]